MILSKKQLRFLIMVSLVVILSGFTNFTEKVPSPKGVPKRTEDVNAGIVVPSFDCTPFDVIKHSYDPLDAFMLDPEEGIFMGLYTSNFDLKPHKLTFYHKKFGFVTHSAYRVRVSFDTETQKMVNFTFAPFEVTLPKPESEVKVIADSWVKFFESQGWKRAKQPYPLDPYGTFPTQGGWPYMVWESDGYRLKLSVKINEFPYATKEGPKYSIHITFDPNPSNYGR